jgi:acyl carrier protein
MTKDECKKLVADIIADIAPDEDLSHLKPEAPLRDQLQLDSMDFLDIVMELRKRHGIEVPEADYIQLASLNSCADYLTPKFNALAAKT